MSHTKQYQHNSDNFLMEAKNKKGYRK